MIKTITLLLFLTAAAAVTVGPSVIVKDLRIFYGEDEYFIKGVAYSPSPLAKIIEGQLDGTGLCTPRKTFKLGSFTETITLSPCNYDDFFDGSVYPGGPSGGWFNGLWARDFPKLKELGTNTLRLYRTWPVTQLSINTDPKYVDKSVVGANHIPFLDMAQQYGFKVLFPLLADQVLLDSFTAEQIQYYIRAFVDEVGYHPALLMYSFGNELQFTSRDAAFVTKVNDYINYARNYQVQKWGRYLPITTGLLDFVDSYNELTPGLAVDLMMLNAGYRGFDFSGLWAQFRYLTCQYQKPVLIGEMGVHKDSTQFDVTSWFPTMWSDIIRHKNFGAIGGFLFEWQEEHWKGVASYGDDWTKYPDVYMGAVSLTPGSGSFPVDNINTKSSGAYAWSGVMQGFQQNVWLVDGPRQLSTVTNNFCDGTFVSPIDGNSPPDAQCGNSMVACGGACIDPNSYCCVSKFILQPIQCPPAAFLANPNTYFNGAPGGSPFPSNGGGYTPPTVAPPASSTTPSSTTTSGSGSTTGSSTTGSGSTSGGNSGSNCPSTLSACGGACYNPSQYCCQNGNLVQISFCSANPTPSSTSQVTPTSSPPVQDQTCQSMFASLSCRTASEDPAAIDGGRVSGARSWLCSNYPQFCGDVNTGGKYSSCNSVEQLSYAMNLYYAQFSSQGPSACDFGGVAVLVNPGTPTPTTQTPPPVATGSNSPTCQSMFSSLVCRTTSEDPAAVDSSKVSGARSWLCSSYPQFCGDISTGGKYSSCNSVEQLSYAMNLYYAQFSSQGSSACSFGGIGAIYNSNTPSTTPAVTENNSCRDMFTSLRCRTSSEDPAAFDSGRVSGARSWLCSNFPQFCGDISTGGKYSSCNSVEQLSYAMSLYYAQYGPGADACSFGGLGNVY